MADSPYHHSQIYRVAAWVAAVLLIGLGVYLTRVQFMDREWLSRVGCLITMLGIWSGIGGVFQERLLYSQTKWRRRNALTAARARLGEENADPEQTEKRLDEIGKSFDNEMSEAAQSIRLSIGVLEVSLLMTGTFLWGFGDLLVQ